MAISTSSAGDRETAGRTCHYAVHVVIREQQGNTAEQKAEWLTPFSQCATTSFSHLLWESTCMRTAAGSSGAP